MNAGQRAAWLSDAQVNTPRGKRTGTWSSKRRQNFPPSPGVHVLASIQTAKTWSDHANQKNRERITPAHFIAASKRRIAISILGQRTDGTSSDPCARNSGKFATPRLRDPETSGFCKIYLGDFVEFDAHLKLKNSLPTTFEVWWMGAGIPANLFPVPARRSPKRKVPLNFVSEGAARPHLRSCTFWQAEKVVFCGSGHAYPFPSDSQRIPQTLAHPLIPHSKLKNELALCPHSNFPGYGRGQPRRGPNGLRKSSGFQRAASTKGRPGITLNCWPRIRSCFNPYKGPHSATSSKVINGKPLERQISICKQPAPDERGRRLLILPGGRTYKPLPDVATKPIRNGIFVLRRIFPFFSRQVFAVRRATAGIVTDYGWLSTPLPWLSSEKLTRSHRVPPSASTCTSGSLGQKNFRTSPSSPSPPDRDGRSTKIEKCIPFAGHHLTSPASWFAFNPPCLLFSLLALNVGRVFRYGAKKKPPVPPEALCHYNAPKSKGRDPLFVTEVFPKPLPGILPP